MSSAAGITLSAPDRARLARIATAMASPLAYDTIADWCREVGNEMKELTTADKASILLPASWGQGAELPAFSGATMFSEDIPLAKQIVYPQVIQPLDAERSVWVRQALLGVWNRDGLWGSWLEEYLRSDYYNQYVIPGRFFDAVGLTRHVGTPGEPATAASVASL